MIDLYKLARDYTTYQSIASDDDEPMDQEDIDYLDELDELNEELGGRLDYPNDLPFVFPQGEEAEYVRNLFIEGGSISEDWEYVNYIDFERIWNDYYIHDFVEIQWRGNYYWAEYR